MYALLGVWRRLFKHRHAFLLGELSGIIEHLGNTVSDPIVSGDADFLFPTSCAEMESLEIDVGSLRRQAMTHHP